MDLNKVLKELGIDLTDLQNFNQFQKNINQSITIINTNINNLNEIYESYITPMNDLINNMNVAYDLITKLDYSISVILSESYNNANAYARTSLYNKFTNITSSYKNLTANSFPSIINSINIISSYYS